MAMIQWSINMYPLQLKAKKTYSFTGQPNDGTRRGTFHYLCCMCDTGISEFGGGLW